MIGRTLWKHKEAISMIWHTLLVPVKPFQCHSMPYFSQWEAISVLRHTIANNTGKNVNPFQSHCLLTVEMGVTTPKNFLLKQNGL